MTPNTEKGTHLACAATGYQARWWGGDPWRACLQCGIRYEKHPPPIDGSETKS